MTAQQDLQHIETIFNSFDADKSGTIELSELINVAQALGEKIEEG
jgi:Ca2+-binding EF-hand superfamily protein